jgi:hypothetical protein
MSEKPKHLDQFLAEILGESPLIPTSVQYPPSDQPEYLGDHQTTDEGRSQPTDTLSSAPVMTTDAVSGSSTATIKQPKAASNEASNNVEIEMAAEQAKSTLAGLNTDTAIRLRWAMRDIKAKRTKLSPVGPDHLAALIDLGFVEMREQTPVLTTVGLMVLD